MNKKFLFGLLIYTLLTTGCSSSPNGNTGRGTFYDRVDEEFGVYTKQTDYTINSTINALNTTSLKYHGRYRSDYESKVTWFSFSNSGFEVTFKGTALEGDFLSTNANEYVNKPFIAVTIDNDYDPDHAKAIQFSSTGSHSNKTGNVGSYALHEHVLLAEGLEDTVHTLRIYKRSECQNSHLALKNLSTDGTFEALQAKNFDLKMEVFGDSVTCGYGVEAESFYENFSTRTENAMKTYANYAANLLNSDISLVSAGGYPLYKSVYSENNKPNNIPSLFKMSDFTHQTTQVNRWNTNNYIPDVVVIALGANDGTYLAKYSKGTSEYTSFLNLYKKQYTDFIETIYSAYPNTLIVVSDEILAIANEFNEIADTIVNEYKKDNKKIIRAKFDARNLAKNKVLPGSGHPNQEMQKIAGYELADAIAKELNISIDTSSFLNSYH